MDGAIEALDLSFKQLGAPHCTLLGEALPESPALRLVDLRSNGLGDDGSNAFAVMLPRSCDAHPRHAPAPSSAMPVLMSPLPAPCHELILSCSVPPGWIWLCSPSVAWLALWWSWICASTGSAPRG